MVDVAIELDGVQIIELKVAVQSPGVHRHSQQQQSGQDRRRQTSLRRL